MVRWIDADETVCEPTQFFEDPRGERSVGGSESEELVCAVATDWSRRKTVQSSPPFVLTDTLHRIFP
jgi:hypothetical protein